MQKVCFTCKICKKCSAILILHKPQPNGFHKVLISSDMEILHGQRIKRLARAGQSVNGFRKKLKPVNKSATGNWCKAALE